MIDLTISDGDIADFQRDGYLIRDRIISEETVEILRRAMARTFEGDYDTGLTPDEVNWRPDRDDAMVTRQICNAWKSNRAIANAVLSAEGGRAAAQLNTWPGARIAQDNLLHKPAVAGGSLGMHQDSAYTAWSSEPLMCTLWIALDDVTAEGGAMEFARGSHRWGKSDPIAEFHAPADYKADFRAASARAGVDEPEMVPVAVPKGGGSLHHGWLWHGSGPNRTDRPRRSVVAHMISSTSMFTDQVGYIYSRYKRTGVYEMDETFFPVLWTADGHRSPHLKAYLSGVSAWSGI